MASTCRASNGMDSPGESHTSEFFNNAIWYAGPLAEAMLLLLTGVVLLRALQNRGMRWGMFHMQDGGAMNRRLPTTHEAKDQAKRLPAQLLQQSTEIGHAQSLERVAHQHGFRDWNGLCAAIDNLASKGWIPGGPVNGRYLSHPFEATVVGAPLWRPGWFQLELN
jgi:hypothetical protein